MEILQDLDISNMFIIYKYILYMLYTYVWPHGLSLEFSRQDHWSGWPFLSPEDLLDQGIKSRSPHHRQILYWVSREAHMYTTMHKVILASLVAQSVRNMPAMQETQVWSLGREEPLEKEMATPQYSCLRNPTEGGAWPATVRVMSWTQFSD